MKLLVLLSLTTLADITGTVVGVADGDTMSDPLHEAVERLTNPDPGKLTWWEIALLPVGLILLAGYAAVLWIATLFTHRTRASAGRCIVPLIQSNPDLARKIVRYTDGFD